MVDRSFDEYAFRLAKYGYWNAAQCWRDGDRTSALEVLVRPAWRFFRTYILQLGILDGSLGIIFCLLQSYSTYMKFAILWGWQKNDERGISSDVYQSSMKTRARGKAYVSSKAKTRVIQVKSKE